jgi:hypothetical protein
MRLLGAERWDWPKVLANSTTKRRKKIAGFDKVASPAIKLFEAIFETVSDGSISDYSAYTRAAK